MSGAPERVALWDSDPEEGIKRSWREIEPGQRATPIADEAIFVRADRYDEAIRQRDVAVEALKQVDRYAAFYGTADKRQVAAIYNRMSAAIAAAEGDEG